MSSLLRVQQISTWTESSTEHAYRALLAFIVHKKPKVNQLQIYLKIIGQDYEDVFYIRKDTILPL